MANSFKSLFSTEETTLSGFNFGNSVLAEAVEKAKKNKVEKLGEVAGQLVSKLDTHNNSLLTYLRNARKVERLAKDNLDKFTLAVQYFLDTGNFGPLYPYLPGDIGNACRMLNLDLPSAEDQKIPEKK